MKQCKACPWKKGTKPKKDIPGGYCEKRHRGLKSTIAEPGRLSFGMLRLMACHESTVGSERPCAGWFANQMGTGNNIQLRIAAMMGKFGNGQLELDGPQHERLEDTLPKRQRR